MTRTVDMVEGGAVVVRHTFYGDDEAAAKRMEAAHREADASLDASMKGERYKGTEIKAVRSREAVAIDFDGTITRSAEGDENPLMRRLVDKLTARGQRVSVFSARPAAEVRSWMKQHGWPELEVTNVKRPDFDVFLDDRAVPFSAKSVRSDADVERLSRELEEFAPWWGDRPVRAELAEAKDTKGHGSEKRKALPVGKKDPAEMSAAEINKELDRNGAHQSALNQELIDAGHGLVKFNDLPATGHPAGREMHELAGRASQIRSEIGRRYGPGAPNRLPKGFGPIKRIGEAATAVREVRSTLAEGGRGSNQYKSRPGGAGDRRTEPPTKDEARARFGPTLDRLDARFDGVWDLRDVGKEPHLAYTDNVTGSSLMTPMSKATPERLAALLQAKRRSFSMSRATAVDSPSYGMDPQGRAGGTRGYGNVGMERDDSPAVQGYVAEVRARVAEGGKGSGIVSHVDPALTAEAREEWAKAGRRPRPTGVRATLARGGAVRAVLSTA